MIARINLTNPWLQPRTSQGISLGDYVRDSYTKERGIVEVITRNAHGNESVLFRKTYGEGASDSVWATSVEKLVLLDSNMREEYLGIYEELNKNYKVSEDFEVGVEVSDINDRKKIFIGLYVAFDSVVNAICAIPFEDVGKQRDYDYLEICTFSELTVTGTGVRDKLADKRKLRDLCELPKVEVGTKVRNFLNGHEAHVIETTRSHDNKEEVSLPMTVNNRFMGSISYNVMSIELI